MLHVDRVLYHRYLVPWRPPLAAISLQWLLSKQQRAVLHEAAELHAASEALENGANNVLKEIERAVEDIVVICAGAMIANSRRVQRPFP